jgi:hypothetical protein
MSVEGMDLLDQLSVLSSDVGRDEVQELREALRASARMRAQVLDAKKDHAKLVKYQAAAQESAKEVSTRSLQPMRFTHERAHRWRS